MQAQLVKKAYHRALLRHHPDKAGAGNNGNTHESNKSPSSSPSAMFTVDQIQEAYAVLSDSRRRGEYDRQQRLSSTLTTTSSSSSGPPAAASSQTTKTWSFRTGVETVDLDDLGFDERTGVYFRPCRCGNPRGYRFEDDDLAACEDDGVLVVGCADCSLWLRVLFAPAGEEDDDDDAVARDQDVSEHQQHQQQQVQKPPAREVSGAGGAADKGFRFNWSFSLGVSVGGSVSASAGSTTSRS